MRLRKEPTPETTIDLDRPIDKFEFMRWKKQFPKENPLRKAYIDGQALICDSENDRMKIIAYLLTTLENKFQGCI
jgi:hypothetical protein